MNVVVPLIVFVTLGVGVLFWAARPIPLDERERIMKLVFLAFALRVAVAVTFEMVPALRLFHEDANGYELIGIRLADAWRGRAPPYPLADKNYGFFVLSAALAYAFGPFPLNVAMFNTAVGSLTMLLIYRLARKIFHPTVALMSAALVGFAPSMIMWSAIALKDALATCLIVMALSSCVSLKERVTWQSVAGIVLPVIAMQPIRFYLVYFVLFGVAASLIFDPGDRVVSKLYKQVVVGGSMVGLFVMLGLAGSAVEGTEQFDLRFAHAYRQGMAVTAHSGYGQDVDISTPQGALAFLPVGVANLLLAPFPWQMTSFRTLIAAPETIAWWFLFPATLRGIAFAVRRKFGPTSPLLMFMVSLTGVYGVAQGNVGSAFRQRAQIFVFLFIFTALGIYLKRCKKLGVDESVLLRGAGEG